MILLDLVNALFETVGAVLTWRDVRILFRDKHVAGVSWWARGWWGMWGAFNVVYYYGVGHPLSMYAGAVLTLGNLAWTYMAMRYTLGCGFVQWLIRKDAESACRESQNR